MLTRTLIRRLRLSRTGRLLILLGVQFIWLDFVVCATDQAPQSATDPNLRLPVYVINTNEYRKHTDQMKVGPHEAKTLAQEHARKGDAALPDVGFHLIVVGDEYFFGSRWEKTRYVLHGYFVNGITGRVEHRRPLWRISFRDNPELSRQFRAAQEEERQQRRSR